MCALRGTSASAPEKEKLYDGKLNVTIPHISTDKAVKYDYDIVYVRAKRDGHKAGTELASSFEKKSNGVWEYAVKKPLASVKRGTLTVSVKDRQGNVTKVTRTFVAGTAD